MRFPEKIPAVIGRGDPERNFSYRVRADAKRLFISITGKAFMFVKKPHCITCLFIVMFTVFVPIEDANAQPPDWYAAASFGQASISENTLDGSNTSAFSLGRRFDDKVAFEFSYTDLGKFDRKGFADTYLELTGYEASWYGATKLGGSMEIFARGGLLQWKLEGTNSGVDTGSKDGLSLLLGVGADIPVTGNFGARLQWTNYFDIQSEDVDALTLGVYFRF